MACLVRAILDRSYTRAKAAKAIRTQKTRNGLLTVPRRKVEVSVRFDE